MDLRFRLTVTPFQGAPSFDCAILPLQALCEVHEVRNPARGGVRSPVVEFVARPFTHHRTEPLGEELGVCQTCITRTQGTAVRFEPCAPLLRMRQPEPLSLAGSERTPLLIVDRIDRVCGNRAKRACRPTVASHHVHTAGDGARRMLIPLGIAEVTPQRKRIPAASIPALHEVRRPRITDLPFTHIHLGGLGWLAHVKLAVHHGTAQVEMAGNRCTIDLLGMQRMHLVVALTGTARPCRARQRRPACMTCSV